MKSMLKNYSLGALACIVLGVALVIRPHIITDVLNTALGVILIAWAIFGIMGYIFSRVRGGEERSIFSLFSEVILLIAGIVVLSNKSLLETVVMIALGLYLMCSGFAKLGTSLSVKARGRRRLAASDDNGGGNSCAWHIRAHLAYGDSGRIYARYRRDTRAGGRGKLCQRFLGEPCIFAPRGA